MRRGGGGCVEKSLLEINRCSVMNRIMLKFRPIAPKPAGGGAISGAEEQEGRINGRRIKRKYVRVRGRPSTKRKNKDGVRKSSPPEKSGIEDESPPEKGVVTLQLLPERSVSDKSDNSTARKIEENWKIDQNKVDEEINCQKVEISGGGCAAAVGTVRSVIKTWIIMECVTDTFIDNGVGLGFSDVEKINNLEKNTCPGFVSDGANKVVWVNEAYRQMVTVGDVVENGLMVWLVVRENFPHFSPAFTCRLRVIQQTKHGHKWNRIVPCDVWRMDFAGFAWKLDVNTALSLGI